MEIIRSISANYLKNIPGLFHPSIIKETNLSNRIDFFSKGFKLPEYFFEIYNSKTVDVNKVNELKDYLKNTVAGNQTILFIATDKDFLTKMDALVDQIVKGKK